MTDQLPIFDSRCNLLSQPVPIDQRDVLPNRRCPLSALTSDVFGFLLCLMIQLYFSAEAPAQTFTTVNVSRQANFSWFGTPDTDAGDGGGIPLPGAPHGSVTLGGIPFNIASNGDQEQAWNADAAAGNGSAQVGITMPVGLYGVTKVYTLINTGWGAPGPTSYASLIFTGSAGATYTYALVGGSDIRNWLLGGAGSTYTINGTSTVNVYSGATPDYTGYTGVLDMQKLILPSTFSTQTLTSVELLDNGARYFQRTVLDGVTVQSPSEPSISWTNPAPILYGTPLSSLQLNATANIPGVFNYSPTNGTVLNAGTNTLSVAFTPTDTVNYSSITDTVSVVVFSMPSAPLFTQQPVNQVVSPGQPIRFSVTATGYPLPTYQWQLNGTNISGATSSSYTVSSTALTNIGFYTAVVANSVSTNTSASGSLTFLSFQMYSGVNIYGPIGANYKIQSTSDLNGSNWTTLTNISLPTQPYIYIDHNSPTNAKQFYQAVPQ